MLGLLSMVWLVSWLCVLGYMVFLCVWLYGFCVFGKLVFVCMVCSWWFCCWLTVSVFGRLVDVCFWLAACCLGIKLLALFVI